MPPVTPRPTKAMAQASGGAGLSFSTDPACTSCSARRAGFGGPSTFGTQPWRSCRARAEATVTYSNEFFGRLAGRGLSLICLLSSGQLRSFTKGLDDLIDCTPLPAASRALGRHDRGNFAHTPLELIVDDD